MVVSVAPSPSRLFWFFVVALLAAVTGTLAILVMRATPGPDLRPTAAVLPVAANMIGGDNDNYSAQITEAITSELSRLADINVASFASALQVGSSHPSIHDAAAALRSRYVVDGSVDDEDRKSTRLNSSHVSESRMPSSA